VTASPLPRARRRLRSAAQKRVVTVQGLSEDGRLHPVQQAFMNAQGSGIEDGIGTGRESSGERIPLLGSS
jgi:hypothetical protein